MSDKTPKGEPELGFLAHLYELRDRLLRIVIAVGILFLILMPFAQDLFNILAYPLASQMPDGEKLVSIRPAGPFLVPFKLALLVAFLVALPYVLYQIWGFVAPGLYKHEKRLAVPMLVSSTLLFYCGIAFAYFVLLPLVFSVLPQFTPETATYMPDIGHYMDFVMTLFLAFGIGFEMPVATVLLITTGMATRESLAKKRPYIVVGSFIVGMLLTPPDVISQLLLAIPMWLLFEFGLIASPLFAKQVKVANAEKEAREEAERAAADKEYEDDSVTSPESSASKGNDALMQSTAAASAAAIAAGKSAAEHDEPDDESDADNNMWEDDQYTYSDDVDPTGPLQFEETDEYKPLTDDEMDAELERIESEEAESEAAADKEAESEAAADKEAESEAAADKEAESETAADKDAGDESKKQE